jgi:hypothetical protein
MSWAISTALMKQSGEAAGSASRDAMGKRDVAATQQDFAASRLVCDHVRDFIIGWRRDHGGSA